MYVKSLPLCLLAASCLALPTQAEETATRQPAEGVGKNAFLRSYETWDECQNYARANERRLDERLEREAGNAK